MKVGLSKAISYIIFAVIGVTLLYYVFDDVDLSAMWHNIVNANYWWVLVALLFAMGGYTFRALRWNLLIESTCGRSPSLWDSFWALMFGYFANLALPRVGEITRCGALARTNKMPFDTLVGTVIVERVFDLLLVFLLAAITFFIKIDFFGTFIMENVVTPTISSVTSISITAVVAILVAIVLVVFVFVFLKENVVMKKVRSFTQGMVNGIKSVYKLEKRWLFLFYTVMLWVCYWVMTWIICFSIAQTSHLGIVDGLFLLIIGSLGMSVPVQNGIGVYHFIVAKALTIYGLDYTTVGLLYATISHESQLILEIVLGLASMFIVFKKEPSV